MSGPPPDDDPVALLAVLLEATHAAVYGYGVLGARLDPASRRAALRAVDAHRARRDSLAARLRSLGATPPVALPAYDVEVDGAQQALELAVQLEQGLSVRWLDLVAGTDELALRQLAVDGLQETAVRAAEWRLRQGTGPVTVALPGTG